MAVMGDSLTEGTTPTASFTCDAASSLGLPYYTQATAGYSSAAAYSAMATLFAKLPVGAIPLFHLLIGTNDVNGGVTVDVTIGDIEAMLEMVRIAYGAGCRCVVGTVTPASPFYLSGIKLNTWRMLNSLIRGSSAEAVIDYAVCPSLIDCTNAAIYSDGTHFTAAGKAAAKSWLLQELAYAAVEPTG